MDNKTLSPNEMSTRLGTLEQCLRDMDPRDSMYNFARYLIDKMGKAPVTTSAFVMEYLYCLTDIQEGWDGHLRGPLPEYASKLQQDLGLLIDNMPIITQAICPSDFAEAAIKDYETTPI